MPAFLASSSPEDARHRRRPARSTGLGVLVGCALGLAACSGSPSASGDPAGLAGAEASTETAVNSSPVEADDDAEADDDGTVVSDEEAGVVDPSDLEPVPLVELEVDEPEAVIAEVTAQLQQSQTADTGTGTDLLALVGPVDGREPAGDADTADTGATGTTGHRYNEAGELIQLDQSALLACGQVEIAIGLIDRGELAAADDRLDRGSEQAEQSSVTAVQSWAGPLAAVAANGGAEELAPLIGFLSVCADGGYEL